MREIESIIINDEPINIFDYVWYLVKEENLYLELEIVVSEIAASKYAFEKELKILLKYKDGNENTLVMSVQSLTEVGNAEVPILELSTQIASPHEFEGLMVIYEDTDYKDYPKLRDDITIEKIREVEMPNKEVDIVAVLPIDLAEWIYKNNENISEVLKHALYEYQDKTASK